MLDSHYQHINDLVAQAQEGAEEALTDLASYYRPLLLQSIRRCVLKMPELDQHREDLHGEAYLALRDLVQSYNPDASYFSYYLSAWLPNALQKRCRRLIAGSNEVREIMFSEMPPEWEPEDVGDALGRWELQQAVQMAVGKLRPPQQEAIRLYFFEGLTQEEAAAQLGITQASFCKRLQRALSRLKTLFSDQG